jgi:hypothetical protein
MIFNLISASAIIAIAAANPVNSPFAYIGFMSTTYNCPVALRSVGSSAPRTVIQSISQSTAAASNCYTSSIASQQGCQVSAAGTNCWGGVYVPRQGNDVRGVLCPETIKCGGKVYKVDARQENSFLASCTANSPDGPKQYVAFVSAPNAPFNGCAPETPAFALTF